MSGESSTAGSASNNSFINPKPKEYRGLNKSFPFPIVRDSEGNLHHVIGHLKELSVEVSDEKDMELIFTHGFFGKGTFSRSTPLIVEEKMQERYEHMFENQCKKSDRYFNLPLPDDSNGKSENESLSKHQKKNKVELMETDESSDDTTTEKDSSSTNAESEQETLQLSLEEAFFLSYGLGVLVVKKDDQPLNLLKLWQTFCDIHPNKNFPVMYAAYHHFRSIGWVVRSGIKFGCDFVLYKDGPPFYHSSYGVIVQPVKANDFSDVSKGGRPNLTWGSLGAVHRTCSHASKGVIILYVIKPASAAENKMSTPNCLPHFKVEEVLVKRWVPSEEQK